MDRRAVLVGLATAALSGVPAQPAGACSIGYKAGYSPAEIKQRKDLRKIEGVYRLAEVAGERFTDENGQELVRDAKLLGEIKAKNGRTWKTIQPPPDALLVDICGCDCWYHKPEGNAEGTFWLSHNGRNGRYTLMLWEGNYLHDEAKG